LASAGVCDCAGGTDRIGGAPLAPGATIAQASDNSETRVRAWRIRISNQHVCAKARLGRAPRGCAADAGVATICGNATD
jgi:hypothetical protein